MILFELNDPKPEGYGGEGVELLLIEIDEMIRNLVYLYDEANNG